MSVLTPGLFPVRTDRLIIRPYEIGDRAYLRTQFREVAAYTDNVPRVSQRAALKLLNDRIRRARDFGAWYLGIFTAAAHEYVGDINVLAARPGSGEFYMGYYQIAAQRQRGYMREAVQGLTRTLFEKNAAVRIIATVDERNGRSISLLTKSGFAAEPRSPGQSFGIDRYILAR